MASPFRVGCLWTPILTLIIAVQWTHSLILWGSSIYWYLIVNFGNVKATTTVICA